MEHPVQRLFDEIAELRERATADAVFGQPVTVEGRTLIPVARVGYGFAIGLGSEESPAGEDTPEPERGGGGGGEWAHPLGAIEVTREGVRFEPLLDEQRIITAGTLLAAWMGFWAAAIVIRFLGRE